MRYLYCSLLLWLALLHVAVAAVQSHEKAIADQRPNVVLIISDDQAWTDYSFMGHPHICTPNLDQLAAESLTFTHGYVPSSLCCPSLATIITGLYPHQHGITSNDPPQRPGDLSKEQRAAEFAAGREQMNHKLDAVATLPRILADHGYESLQTGKWWQGDFHHGGFTHGMTKGTRHGDEGLKIGRETMQPIFDFTDSATRNKRPFFVWYAPMMPHQPHTPPQRLLEKYLAVAPSPNVARYWAMVEWFDETIGTLLKHLDENHLRDNTIVLFVADNGWITDPHTGNYAAKSKQSPYEGGIRTPIMIRWPGHIEPHRPEVPASTIDLLPTLLSLLELPQNDVLPGIDLLSPAATKRTAIFGECFTHNAVDLNTPAASLRWRWVLSGNWKLILPAPQNEANGTAELYDLNIDPNEEHNQAARHPELVTALTKKLNDWWPGKL
jgi:uncharacterized sulfatase